MVYYDFLSVIFAPLLKLPPLLAILILSLLVSVIVIVITKYTTDQSLMKRLKEDMKEHQKKLKELRSEPQKALEVQKKLMSANKDYMLHSLKATIFTFVPIILIFGWMSATFAFESIKPQQEFIISVITQKDASGEIKIIVPEDIEVTGNETQEIKDSKVTWILKGDEGEHLLEFEYGSEKHQTSVLITESGEYINPIKKTEGKVTALQINYKKLTVLPIGYKDWLGWLGTYIISSIIFTMALRKFLKVY